MPLGYNRVLGDPRKAAEARPHRVGLANWPTWVQEPRTASLEALLNHVSASGYEGVEFGLDSFAKYFPQDSRPVVARKARAAVEQRGLEVFGSTQHIADDQMRALNWIDPQLEDMKLVRDLGGQYVSYQVFLHPDYLHTGGSYREDERYLQWCAGRVSDLREAAWDLGLNFYLEVHVDRITDDPAACCRILQLAACEINGDLSHLLARGITRGRYVQTILQHMGHTHVRLARMYGDLSAGVDDPKADWEKQGVTWTLFQLMKEGLRGGLSSRAIVGETGPMYLVTDPLTQDAKLVPLYRAMARYADASAQGMDIKVEEPGDLRPWG